MHEQVCEALLSALSMWVMNKTLRRFLFSCDYCLISLCRERRDEGKKQEAAACGR